MRAIQVLFQGLSAPASQIITLVLAFMTICVGITILQMSKIDPIKLTSLDRRSTLLLQAARAHTDTPATIHFDADGEDKEMSGLEDPGMGALRGSFGTIGSIMRARSTRRLSQSSRTSGSARAPRGMGVGGGMVGNLEGLPFSTLQHTDHSYDGLTRHALYDAPMPTARSDSTDRESQVTASSQSPRRTMIKFGVSDVVHSYAPTGNNSSHAVHALRTTSIPANLDTRAPSSFLYPPTSMANSPTGAIPTLPPPPGDGRNSPQIPQRGVQSIVIPERGNDEPLAPTRSEHDPFETPSTPSTSAFSSENNLFGNESSSLVNLSGSTGYSPSVASTESEQTVYETPVSGTLPMPMRPADAERQHRNSSSTSRSRRYPRGVDDAGERQSLWLPEEGEQYPGVRLVQPTRSTGGRF